MAQMNDGPTDEDLNAAMAVLINFAARHLPEGYVVQLTVSTYDSDLSVTRDDDDGPADVHLDPGGWGSAVDAAIDDAKQQQRLGLGFID